MQQQHTLETQPYNTRGAKTVRNRLYILSTGLLGLFGLNYLLLIDINAIAILLTVMSGWACYRYIRRVQNIRYYFDKKGIRITTPTKKNYNIPRSDIKKREKCDNKKYQRILPKNRNTVNYATSTRHLYCIHTHEDLRIYISPYRLPTLHQKRQEKIAA